MKILYVLGFINGYGGIERTIITKANYFADVIGYEVTIAVFCSKHPFRYPLSDKVNVIDYNIDIYSSSLFKRAYLSFILKRQIKKTIKQVRPDIVLTLATCSETGWIAQNQNDFVNVVEVHRNYHIAMERKGIRGKMATIGVKKSINGAARFVVLTSRDADLYEEAGFKRPLVIPNPSPFEIQSESAIRQNVILAVGRLSFEKNFGLLIKIWARIANRFPDWKLRILGDGEQYDNILSLAHELNIANRIEIEYSSKVQAEYLNASIQVMTSLYEGLPMTLIEGASCGLPAISFDIDCGPRDVIIDGQSGFLIKPFNEEVFADKLSILIQNENLRKQFSENSLIQAQKYQQSNVMTQWVNLFESLINK